MLGVYMQRATVGAVLVQPPDRGVLPALAAAPPRPRRVGEGVGSGGAVRLRPDPAGVRERGQLPRSRSSSRAQSHRGAERVDGHSGPLGFPSGYVLGCGVQGWVGAVGGGAGAEACRGGSLFWRSFAYIVLSPKCKETWKGFKWEAFTGLWDFVKLSIASAVMLCLETWYYQVLVLITGLLENPELALDALSVW
ncbi:protein transparent testa 12 [Phtheirospermum japonicum]|uniref:Protein transparent testa 12 n=1 Tax=Phtheirospermum japonicum TaxID=374723 RepID=A0A830BWU3_9LAMI|nr:protein transparent testa 12 [Phtheirospermum japonicum]